jgi:MOSC domain-containing protein YiiM
MIGSHEAIVEALVSALATLKTCDTGIIAHLVEKPAPGIHEERVEVSVIPGVGFAGDHSRKSFWKGEAIPGREVTAISKEVAAVLGFDPLVVGDNLVTSGFDLAGLRPGSRLRVGTGVELVRSEKDHRPCALFRERTSDAAYRIAQEYNHRGALFVVASGGVVRVGDSVRVCA